MFLSISYEFYQQAKASPSWSEFLLPSRLASLRLTVVPKLGFLWNHLGVAGEWGWVKYTDLPFPEVLI